MKKPGIISLILVVVTVIGFLFYWYEYREYKARRECNDIYARYSDEEYKTKFAICLNNFGF